jgi:hypothetical protein
LFRTAETQLQAGGDDVSMWKEVADGLRNACQIIPEWTSHGACVRIAGNGWMVSYKAQPSDSDDPETALIDRRTGASYILSGDHRHAYKEAAAGGWEALFAVYSIAEGKRGIKMFGTTQKRKLAGVVKVLTHSQRGIHKRIDENRELLELLQERAPEFLEKHFWVEGWLRSQDEFLSDLLAALPVPNPVPAVNFPPPWPMSSK